MCIRDRSEIEQLLAGYAAILGTNPWVERVPFGLRHVVPFYKGSQWAVADADGSSLPIAPYWQGGWQLLAVSGGAPLDLLGEWNGYELFPLCAVVDGAFFELAK